MIPLTLEALSDIERGVRPEFKVKVFWKEPEEYTLNDYLQGVGDLEFSALLRGRLYDSEHHP